MGIYLNPGADAFLISRRSSIYVDKSDMIRQLNAVVNTEQRFVCISRPRRFGKSMAANMICAYYDRTVSKEVFDGLKISSPARSHQVSDGLQIGSPARSHQVSDGLQISSLVRNDPVSDGLQIGSPARNDPVSDGLQIGSPVRNHPDSEENPQDSGTFDRDGMSMQGQYDVIRLNMQEFLSSTSDMPQLLKMITKVIVRELVKEYPQADLLMPENLMLSMADIYNQSKRQFVIIIDEWDCIFREYPDDKTAQEQYLDFLRNWLKDKSYVALAYMTGILPIKKYGTHSALNIFLEYSMEHPDQYAEYVGFTEEETRQLCSRFQMDFDECRAWYDGYAFPECAHIYSPKSVVDAMLRRRFGSYWNNTETYEALKIYIDLNEGGLRDMVIRLMGGGRQRINTGTFQNDMTSIKSADDVLTLLVHLGYLGYDSRSEEVFIPNNEILREFVNATQKGDRWNLISSSIERSDSLLHAVWNGDACHVAKGVEEAHFETSMIQYNDENALSYVLSLAFYSARRYYNIIRELPSGKGFADLAFIPRPMHQDKPAMIVELKWDDTADTAIRQIYEKCYPRVLKDYQGRMLLVGVSYDRKTKKHSCVIERA